MDRSDLRAGFGFLARLPGFLHRRDAGRAAAAVVRGRIERRGEAFLGILRDAVFPRPDSPYARLLRRAGLGPGDVERAVRRDGLEAALALLLRAGVYLTVDEFKGRVPVRRDGAEFPAGPDRLRNPLSRVHVAARSSGSRGAGTPVVFDLEFISDCAADAALFFSLQDGLGWAKADWEVPGGGALFRLLKFSRFGRRPERWFSQVDPAAAGIHPRYRWSARAARWGSVAALAPLPRLRPVAPEDPRPIVRWLRERLDGGAVPLLFTFPSSAVLVARAAAEAGTDLAGARFLIGGEPVTEARVRAIRSVGAVPLPRYGTIETGPIAYACLRPEGPDDLHVLSDLQALVAAGPEGGPGGVPPGGVFLTGLRRRSPFVAINVSMGDLAEVAEGGCGCPLEAAGWTRRLRRVRSFEKLTGAGMTFLDRDVIDLLEVTLPGRFGGLPTDYQLLEDEAADGRPRLRLLVHPRLGALDPHEVAAAFLEAAAGADPARRVMTRAWAVQRVVVVERRPPVTTRSGKILHLVASR